MSLNEALFYSTKTQIDLEEFLQQHELNKLAEHLHQTNRFKKVDINDIAIAKIPYVKYPGINIEDCVMIHDLAQEVLQISKTENNNNEVAITYSLDYKELEKKGEVYKTVVKGNEYETDITADTDTFHLLCGQKRNILVSLHNHPTQNIFSIFDILLFLQEPTIGYMIVITNRGELHYMYKKPELYDSKAALALLAQTIVSIVPEAHDGAYFHQKELKKEQMIEVSKKFLKKALEVGIVYHPNSRNEIAISQYDIMAKESGLQNIEEEAFER